MRIQELEAAVDRFFSDRSRPASETREQLEGLVEHIETLIESLPEGDE